MKILMFGRGGIATIYGWAIENAGHTVSFYVRPGRKEKVPGNIEIDIYDLRKTPESQRRIETWSTSVIDDLSEEHDYDVIILSVQHYQFDDAARFLSTKIGGATLLIFNNFWTDPQEAVGALPAQQLAWGFPAAGVNIDTRGTLRGALMPYVEFGTFGTDPNERELDVRQLFREAGFVVKEHRDFRDWLWIHFARNAAMLAQAARAGSFAKVMRSLFHATQMIYNVREVLKVVAARGVSIEGRPELASYSKPAWLTALKLNKMFRSNAAMRASVEGEANLESSRRFYEDFMAESKRLGVALPRMEALRSYFKQE